MTPESDVLYSAVVGVMAFWGLCVAAYLYAREDRLRAAPRANPLPPGPPRRLPGAGAATLYWAYRRGYDSALAGLQPAGSVELCVDYANNREAILATFPCFAEAEEIGLNVARQREAVKV